MIRGRYLPMPAVALIDILSRVADGAGDLAAQGYLYDPDDLPGWRSISVEVAAELATLVAECWECRRGPSGLARHWLNRQEVKYYRALPTWTCPCGKVYKPIGEPGSDQEFYEAADDGLPGGQVGVIRVNSKGKVTRSDKCPGCGQPFAATIALQLAVPMQYAAPSKARARPAARKTPAKTTAGAADDSQPTLF